MVEWSKAADCKLAWGNPHVGSNPTIRSVTSCSSGTKIKMNKGRGGRMARQWFAKPFMGVRIPPPTLINVEEMDKNKVKIELYKSKVMAKLSHYVSGNIYYTVQMEDGKYQFPIETVEDGPVSVNEVYEDKVEYLTAEKGKFVSPGISTKTPATEVKYTKLLSSDLGTTSFYNEMKASELNRWIGKAIDKKEFIKIG